METHPHGRVLSHHCRAGIGGGIHQRRFGERICPGGRARGELRGGGGSLRAPEPGAVNGLGATNCLADTFILYNTGAMVTNFKASFGVKQFGWSAAPVCW